MKRFCRKCGSRLKNAIHPASGAWKIMNEIFENDGSISLGGLFKDLGILVKEGYIEDGQITMTQKGLEDYLQRMERSTIRQRKEEEAEKRKKEKNRRLHNLVKENINKFEGSGFIIDKWSRLIENYSVEGYFASPYVEELLRVHFYFYYVNKRMSDFDIESVYYGDQYVPYESNRLVEENRILIRKIKDAIRDKLRGRKK